MPHDHEETEEDRLGHLEERLQRLEDEAAIVRLMASYGPLVDVGDADGVAELWLEDGTYDVDWYLLEGRQGLRRMVLSQAHQDFIQSGSLHFLGMPHVTVHADTATAVCESMLVLHQEGQFIVRRGTANQFGLRRTPAGWRIVTRTSHMLDGSDAAPDLLRLQDASPSAE